MKYSNDFVKKILVSQASARAIEKTVRVSRKTIGIWRSRAELNLPIRFKRIPKKVWNKTITEILLRIKKIFLNTKSTIQTWIKLVNKISLRTIQRYCKFWFPKKPKEKIEYKRYERRKVFSLMHTDWAVKRIALGKRCCFSFYIDDASRKLFALEAYKSANQINTLLNLESAVEETGGFKALLSDNGKVYNKTFDANLTSSPTLKGGDSSLDIGRKCQYQEF